MFLVLWAALIFNSILITKQVSYHKIKPKNSYRITQKFNSQTVFDQKFWNLTLRKERRNFQKNDIYDWGYDDISEPLQYNHKDVWWTTNYYPGQGDKTQKVTKINNFNKNLTKITTKPTTKVDNLQMTMTVIVTSKLTKPNNVTKSITNKIFTNTTTLAFKNLPETTKTLVRSQKKTTQTKNLFTIFNDVSKGFYLPVLTKNDNGEFSVVANKTNLVVKKNENDSAIHGSITDNIFMSNDLDIGEFDFIVINDDVNVNTHTAQRQNSNNKKTVIKVIQTENIAESIKNQANGSKIIITPEQSKILPNVIKDGIYRIEIPDPVTIKTNPNPEIYKTYFEANAPLNNYPPRPLVEDYNIQSGNSTQAPFFNTKSSGYRPGPFYITKSLGQNIQGPINNLKSPPFAQQGPFYNTKYPGYERQRPFYGTELGQNGQGRFYNPQNPGFDQGPFRDPQNPGPFYGTKSFGQNKQGPFYITQNPGFGKQKPFYGPRNPDYGPPENNYGTNSIGQNRQGPFYNPQNPGFERGPFHGPQNPNYDRPGPNYGTNSIGLNRQVPYNPQNPGFGNQRPFYGLPNPDYGPPGPNDGTNEFEQYGPEIEDHQSTDPNIVQNPSNDIQGPLNDINGTEHDKKTTDLGRQGPPLTTVQDVPNEIFIEAYKQEHLGPVKQDDESETTAITNAYREVVEITRSTFEPGKGPRKEDIPYYFEGPTIAPVSTYVKHLIDDMEQLKVGYFSMFLIKLFDIVAMKKPDPLRRLMSHAQIEAVNLFNHEHLLVQFGEPFGSSLMNFANYLDIMAVDVAQSAATMLHHAMVNRQEGVTQDINSVIDYIDTLYEEEEGKDLLRVVEDIDKYPDGGLNRAELHRKLSRVMYEPARRLSGTAKRQILIESLNKVIENHMKVPPGAIVRRQGSNLNSNFKFHFIKSKKGLDTYNKRNTHQQYTKEKKKDYLNSNPTKRYQSFTTRRTTRSTASTKDTKHAYRLTDKTKIKSTNNNAKTINYRQENHTKRINKLKFNLAKANNFNFNTIPNNAIRSITNYTSVEEEPDEEAAEESDKEAVEESLEEIDDETMTQIDIFKTEATTTEPSTESSKSTKQHNNRKDKKRKLTKASHLHKKEIRHLKQKHPKMYENYLRHLKKSKHDKKHRKGYNHGHKKKSHHSKKKKRSKISKKIKNIERHYEHLLRHYMMRKTHLKTGINDNKEKMSEESKDILSNQNDTNEYSYLYNSFKSIEKEISKDIKLNVMTTPNFAFITPLKKNRFSENDKTTKNWFHYPIFQTTPRTTNQNDWNNKLNKNFPINRLVPTSESMEVFQDGMNNFPKLNFNKHSSYSDEEQSLKFNLHDAMRHDGVYVEPHRRALEVKKKGNKLRTFSSYSSEEVVLKSNIYKAVGFNKYHSRANFSDIIKRDYSNERAKKIAFRSRFQAVSDSTSSSDDAEDILKQKLRLR